MDTEWQYQIRIYLPNELAEVARRDPKAATLGPLPAVLDAHWATVVSQLDAFEGYVAEAEREGVERYPLYKWTQATLEDAEKRRKYLMTFTVRVDGQEVYPQGEADALEAALQPLVGGGVISRLTRHDTNPANNPQPPPQYR